MNGANDSIRVNKYLTEAGYCSRREADRLLEEGRVTSSGRVLVVGEKIPTGADVEVDGRHIMVETERILIAYNKPRDVVVTSANHEGNIIREINYPKRVFPVGRLDKDSTGLILLTNEGRLSNEICKAANRHEKEYIVGVDKKITDRFIEGMSVGVPILGTLTRRCEVEQIDDNEFRIVLTQGMNRQIRRMCEHFKYRVTSLHRVRVMNVLLGDLLEGEYRDVTDEERAEMKRLLNWK